MPPQPLPDYENPPVIEVVIGSQFAPIAGFLPTHLGLFWQLIREDYPRVESAAPLSAIVEQFGSAPAVDSGQLDIYSIPPLPRVLFIDPTDSWLVQLQPDRLLQNWRKGESQTAYPRFGAVIEKFENSWKIFDGFCDSQDLELPEVTQLEVTYINHIPAGEGWNAPHDLGAVFPDFTWRGGERFLPPPEALAWKMAFVMPERQGRLHVSVRQAVRKSDAALVLLCELTARGKPIESSSEAIRSWFELAREWIVRGFADLMSDNIQSKNWGRKA